MGLNLCLQQASTVLSRLVTLSAYRVARNAAAGSQITARLAYDSVHESMVGGEWVEVADDPIVKWEITIGEGIARIIPRTAMSCVTEISANASYGEGIELTATCSSGSTCRAFC
jgi:hypothetical protein